jgi:uncharacterized phiE125 gp8 family phage protein
MKVIVNRTPLGDAEPVLLADLRGFVRLIDSAGEFDAELVPMARAAAAEIEHFAQIALLMQSIRVEVINPDAGQHAFALPIGPVASDASVSVTIDGAAFDGFILVHGNRPALIWDSAYSALTPKRLTVEYPAGFGVTAADIPADLTQALLDQTALHFYGRSPMDARELSASPHMARIGARYRGVQL